jgi:hypothetical protein
MTTPEIGMKLTQSKRFGEQEYQLLGIYPCLRQDGKPSQFAIWRTQCPRCGSAFECTSAITKTHLAKLARGKAGLARRCPTCRSEAKSGCIEAA